MKSPAHCAEQPIGCKTRCKYNDLQQKTPEASVYIAWQIRPYPSMNLSVRNRPVRWGYFSCLEACVVWEKHFVRRLSLQILLKHTKYCARHETFYFSLLYCFLFYFYYIFSLVFSEQIFYSFLFCSVLCQSFLTLFSSILYSSILSFSILYPLFDVVRASEVLN